MEQFKCEKCNKEFGSEGALASHNQAKHPPEAERTLINPKTKKRIKFWTITLLVIIIFWYGFYRIANVKGLPPTDMSGHIEVNPPSHVMRTPMRIEIQKHMLEHVDGGEGGRGGIIINYDCENYECEEGLIDQLESFADEFDFVYVAPYNNMKSKIVLTRLGRLKQLDEYDENIIRFFVGG